MLALADAAEASFWFQNVANKVLGISSYNIECFAGSLSLLKAVYSMTPLLGKHLRVDVAILCEMIQKNEISKMTLALEKCQLVDCLTKKGYYTALLIRVLLTNQF